MSSPFDWKGKPSKLGKQLQAEQDKRKSAQHRYGAPISLPGSTYINPRQFHVYSKAVQGNESK